MPPAGWGACPHGGGGVNVMWRSAIPSLVLLGLLVGTAILLVAGYGVPVGVGFIIGLLLGTLAAALTWMWIRAGAPGSRSVSFGGYNVTTAELRPDFAEMERFGRVMTRLAGVEQTPLRRVIAIGQSALAGGVRVELIALEQREAGGLLSVAVHSPPPIAPAGSQAEVHVTDDAGTEYLAASSGGGMSSPGWSRQEIKFAPAPPETATTLVVRIDEFIEPFRGRGVATERLAGPWEFRVPLG